MKKLMPTSFGLPNHPLPRVGHCSVPGCEDTILARLLCNRHYLAERLRDPVNKEKARAHDRKRRKTPEAKAAQAVYLKAYRARPEVYERKLARARIDYSTPNGKLEKRLRNRLWGVLRGERKLCSALELVGCSIEELWQWLEKQMLPGMTRENYGKWHVDHKIPCAWFDMSNESEQRKCFHYTNLQPLWATDNMRKGARFSA